MIHATNKAQSHADAMDSWAVVTGDSNRTTRHSRAIPKDDPVVSAGEGAGLPVLAVEKSEPNGLAKIIPFSWVCP